MLYTVIKHGFSACSQRVQGPIYIVNRNNENNNKLSWFIMFGRL